MAYLPGFYRLGHSKSAHQSLGVAPWTLVFLRLPRGPLSILKETWEGAVDPSLNLGETQLHF